jgi:hypothetical protein
MLDKHFAVQWPLTSEQAEQLGDNPPPTSRLYETASSKPQAEGETVSINGTVSRTADRDFRLC